MLRFLASLMLGFTLVVGPVYGATPANQSPERESFKVLDHEVQRLKRDVLELNRDLFLLEEELLYPSNTQVSVFIAMDVGTFFNLDSIQIKIDDKIVSNYLYTKREVGALHRGGVHRIYTGNVKSGEHELVALFVGKGPKERDYRRGANLKFTKSLGPKYIELKIFDDRGEHQPDFVFKEW